MKILRRSLLGLLAAIPLLWAGKPQPTTTWKVQIGDAIVIQDGRYVTVACNGAAIRIDAAEVS